MRLYIAVVVLAGSVGGKIWHDDAELKSGLTFSAEVLAGSDKEPIRPIPTRVETDPRKVDLGKRLFDDKRLSRDNTIACVTCHSLTTGGVDREVRSIGIKKATGAINAPTVFNSGFNFRQFWDGRANNLEDQIDGPTQDPKEMGSNWSEIIAKLKSTGADATAFDKIYPDGITSTNIKDAIAEFERSLYTPNSRFDKFLRGDSNALSDEEKKGHGLFKTNGCIACHQGVGIGGNLFQKFGVMGDYFSARGNLTKADFGRYNVTGLERDRHVFKVPSLRNVALTPPYLHDGSAQTLGDAVNIQARFSLGRRLTVVETEAIVTFLRTLTGEYQGKSLSQP